MVFCSLKLTLSQFNTSASHFRPSHKAVKSEVWNLFLWFRSDSNFSFTSQIPSPEPRHTSLLVIIIRIWLNCLSSSRKVYKVSRKSVSHWAQDESVIVMPLRQYYSRLHVKLGFNPFFLSTYASACHNRLAGDAWGRAQCRSELDRFQVGLILIEDMPWEIWAAVKHFQTIWVVFKVKFLHHEKPHACSWGSELLNACVCLS